MYKVKRKADGSIDKFKARLVVRGFTQQYGVNYDETFSPVVRFTSLRLVLAICCQYELVKKQFDVKTAFLYGNLDENIYMEQPTGYSDGSTKVCKLQKSLYGLKQAPRCWNKRFKDFLQKFTFKSCDSDPCVFLGKINENFVILTLYVDDGLIATKRIQDIDVLLKYLMSEFEITVLDSEYYLGLEIKTDPGSIFVCQTSYIKKILEKFDMSMSKPVSTPCESSTLSLVEDGGENEGVKSDIRFPYREAVGSLMYLTVATRPDIAYAVSYVSRFLDKFQKVHVLAVKRIFKYLVGTQSFGIYFKKMTELRLECYSDADYAGDPETRLSTSGYILKLSHGPISWGSQKQRSVALSTTESEYVAACEAVKELIWIKRFLSELLPLENFKTPLLLMDNQSAMKLIKNPQFHKRSKHIAVRYHFIRQIFEEGEFELFYVPTTEELADIFTKPVSKSIFQDMRFKTGVCSLE